jgi:hypothetical protein
MFPTDEEEAEPLKDCLSRFMKEARALKQLSTIGAAGDGVVKVATFFQTNGTAYLVMEYLSGQSLDALIKANPGGIDPGQLEDILPRLLHAVGCVHDAGLLHRDIKPGNILLREDGRPVLIDFGAVRGSSMGRTVTFTQIYSEGYAPIEQVSGTAQGPFSDIYALGATCYRAIGGTAVDSFTRHQAVLRGKRDPQVPAVQIGAGRYAPRLLRAIDAAMIVTAEDRPQSVGALISMLQGGADDASTVRTPVKLRTEAPPATSVRDEPSDVVLASLGDQGTAAHGRRLGVWAAGAGLGALLIAAGIWGVARLASQPVPAGAVRGPTDPAADADRRAAAERIANSAAQEAERKEAADRAAASVLVQRAAGARAAATDLEHRARAAVAALGLDSKDFLSAADALMTRAENEWVKGTSDLAASDFTSATGLIGTETRAFLEQQSAAYAKRSQSLLSAGDIDGAEKALALAKKIKQGEAGFP